MQKTQCNFSHIFAALLLVLLAGCATISDFIFPQTLDKDAKTEWRKDMLLEIDGNVFRGMALVPKKPTYTIKIYPAEDRIDRLQWRTCHRQDYADKAVKHGFWPWSKKEEFFKMTFSPKTIELDRACPLVFEALAQKHKSLSFGMLIFPDSRPWVNVPARLECNGRVYNRPGGVSECQGHVHSIQKILFGQEAYVDDRGQVGCPAPKKVSKNMFEFFMPKGLCVYVFKILERYKGSSEFRQHKLITYGFEKIPPPEGV